MQSNNPKVLLLTPPFTQLNTPYPATAYIKGFLNTLDVESYQSDLGLEVILKVFSSDGLKQMFKITPSIEDNANLHKIYNYRERYIATINGVISFLQNNDPTLAYTICQRQYLPEAEKFAQLEDLEWAFGTLGIMDKARHLATLYLEDISDYLVALVDPHFGFSRYAERLGMSSSSFDTLYTSLESAPTFIDRFTLQCLDDWITSTQPQLVCLSVPFPGNLYAGLRCGKWLKENYPDTKIALGGGYPNTELRQLSDVRVFEFVDFISLDDGERPLELILQFLQGNIDKSMLKRTLMLENGKVVCNNGSLLTDYKQEDVGTPDYSDLLLKKYLSVIQIPNPMHRLWSDGRWNKLTLAHGCYWGKCTFCDISLSYIKDYEASSAKTLVDRMETLIAQTGQTGFHFVDEAAPPSLMRELALEILRRKLYVSWWTNIRFEKSFSADLCRLFSASGCIAVSGGLEVASDRLLKLIDKGVTVAQVAKVSQAFTQSGIMVHAYLMYGFPTQTAQETIDSLEVVRQLFQQEVLQSAFWHRFAMTAHSPVGLFPDKFKVEKVSTEIGAFANNDLEHLDPEGCEHGLFSEGLKKSLYNYMHGVCLDFELQKWFDFDVPRTTHTADLIYKTLVAPDFKEVKSHHRLVWLYEAPRIIKNAENTIELHIQTHNQETVIACSAQIAEWLCTFLASAKTDMPKQTYKDMLESYTNNGLEDFTLFWFGPEMDVIRETGLLVL